MFLFNIKKIHFIITILIPLGIASGPAISDWLISLSGIFFLIIIFNERKWNYFNNLPFKIFIIWCIYIILLSLFSKNFYLSLESSLFYFRFGIYSLSIWYLLDSYRSFPKYFFYLLFGVFIFVLSDALFQFIAGQNFFGYPDMDSNGNKRLSGIFGEEFVLGSFIARLLPILIGIILLNQINKKFQIPLIIFLIIFSIIIVYLSGERSAFFYSVISSLFILFFILEGKLIKVITISFSLLVIIFISINFNHGKERIFDLTLKQFNLFGNNTSNGIIYNDLKFFSVQHEVIYKTALKIFNDNKVFGIGPKMFREICQNEKYYTFTDLDGSINGCQTHPHNTYLQLLTETGILGTIPILFLLSLSTFFLIKKIFIVKKNIHYNNNNYFFCMILATFITLWPLIPTGNFFNNWLSSIYFMPIGFILHYHYKKMAKK